MTRVSVRRCSNAPLWVIAGDPLSRRRKRRKPDWSTCPGSLHDTYASASQAARVARWWYGRLARVEVPGRH